MSLHHDQRHEETLANLVSADQAPAAFEASALANCVECQLRYREHIELARRLDALGRDEAEDLRNMLAGPRLESGPAEDALLQQVLAGTHRARAPHAPWGWVAATVAAGLALILWLWSGAEPREPGPGSRLALVHPLEEVQAFTPFSWKHPGPGSGWYRVLVFPAGNERAATDSGPLRTTSWSPDPALVASFGPEILYRVELYGGAGEGDLVDSVGAWARLSSR